MNQEEQQFLPIIHQNLCTGCRKCVDICPSHALENRDGKAFLAHPEACTYCSACEDLCPVFAIELPYLIIQKAERKES